jgi:hypothetical protein
MAETCSTDRGAEQSVQNFSRKSSREEVALKKYTLQMGKLCRMNHAEIGCEGVNWNKLTQVKANSRLL